MKGWSLRPRHRIQRRRRRRCSRPGCRARRRTPRRRRGRWLRPGPSCGRWMSSACSWRAPSTSPSTGWAASKPMPKPARSQLTKALQQADDTSSVVDDVRESMAALSTLTTQSLDRIEQVDEAVRSLALWSGPRGARCRSGRHRPAARPPRQTARSTTRGRSSAPRGRLGGDDQGAHLDRPHSDDGRHHSAGGRHASRGAPQRRRHRQPAPRDRGAHRGRAAPRTRASATA